MGERGIGATTLVLIIIIIAAVAIGAYLAAPHRGGGGRKEVEKEKWKELSGGPALNVQMLASGKSVVVPQEKGISASYGYYRQESRVGGFVVTSVGEEYFRGKNYEKVEGRGYLNTSISGTQVDFSYSENFYMNPENATPKAVLFDYEYDKPEQKQVNMEITWNRGSSEMTTTVTSENRTQIVTASLPSEYWDPVENIYVGFTRQISYTIDNISVNLTMNVVGREDVKVPKGAYENCYMIHISQPKLGQDMTFWMSEEGVIPQIEFSQSVGQTSFNLTSKLEHYGISP